MTKYIIIRGNSGSGKSTVAKLLREQLQESTIILGQDTLRREILGVKDRPENLTLKLLPDLITFGSKYFPVVIIEGIYSNQVYGPFFQQFLADHAKETLVYYYDLSLEETKKRHANRLKAQEFGDDLLKRWYLPKDYLNVPQEKMIDQKATAKELVPQIIQDLNNLRD
ncbi:AAA family ATPase [Enterococcus timonensis]|uniref:AAA family ATPase n=1 Tax=Enterococcus timonensis TaxID=1852364 RepID=UPI0008DA3A87|nr:AAA family ATPase [Enterococcus timonensis]